MVRGYQARRKRELLERIRLEGLPVYTMYQRGTSVSGTPLLLTVKRCGLSFKFEGVDLARCATYFGSARHPPSPSRPSAFPTHPTRARKRGVCPTAVERSRPEACGLTSTSPSPSSRLLISLSLSLSLVPLLPPPSSPLPS